MTASTCRAIEQGALAGRAPRDTTMPIRLSSVSADFAAAFNAFLNAKREVAADIETATRAIVDDVAARGDAALLEATEKFDRLKLDAASLRITPAEVEAAVAACDMETVDALKFARDRIELFHQRQPSSTPRASVKRSSFGS